MHSLFVLLAVIVLAPLLGFLPMAALAAQLLVVAWNMSEARHAVRVVRQAPRSDALVLLTCFGLTVVFDMVVSITVGVVLAALLFMRRMAEVSEVALISEPHRRLEHAIPPRVLLYEITGPLFFGAAQKAMSALQTIESGIAAVILDVRSVPALDATAIFNLDSVVEKLRETGVLVVLAGLQRQPLRALVKAGWRQRRNEVVLCHSFKGGVEAARRRSTPAVAKAGAALPDPARSCREG